MLGLTDDVLVPLHLRSNEYIVVLRPVLGLTLYLAEPAWWAREGAAEAYRLFLEAVDPKRLGFFTSSRLRKWQRVEEPRDYLEELSSVKLALDRPRHLFSFTIADYPNTPETAFHYAEVDPDRSERASVLQLTLPPESDPNELMQLALQLTNLGPSLSGVGGYSVRWHRGHQRLAFEHFYLWSQRFVGLDAEDPWEAALTAHEGLHGTSWLTHVGTPLADEVGLDLDRLTNAAFSEDVLGIRTKHGLLLRAGEKPSLGDLNQLDFPTAYAEVARALDQSMAPTPVRFWGYLFEEDRSALWRRRLVDPTSWPVQ